LPPPPLERSRHRLRGRVLLAGQQPAAVAGSGHAVERGRPFTPAGGPLVGGRLNERRIFGVAFVVIVTLAVYLRLAHLELAEFKRDEAQIALMASAMAAGRSLPLVGIGTSIPGLEIG